MIYDAPLEENDAFLFPLRSREKCYSIENGKNKEPEMNHIYSCSWGCPPMKNPI
jgi:hypothetical protein